MSPSVAQAPGSPQAKDKPVDPDHVAKMAKGTELFKTSVRGILQAKCVKCHSGERIEGEFDMGTRESLLKGGGRGAPVVPGDHKKSLLYQMTAHLKEPHMPHERAKLADADIAKIAEWIDLGAPYDKPFVEKDDAAWTRKVIAADAQEALGVSAARESRSRRSRGPNPIDALPAGEARSREPEAEPARRQADAHPPRRTSTSSACRRRRRRSRRS